MPWSQGASTSDAINVSVCGLHNNGILPVVANNVDLIGDNGETGMANAEITTPPGTSLPTYPDPPAWTPSILPPLYSPPKVKKIRVKVVYDEATLMLDAKKRAAEQHAREMKQLQRHKVVYVYDEATLILDAKKRAAEQHAREMKQLQRHKVVYVYDEATLILDTKKRAAEQHAREMQQLQRHKAGRPPPRAH